MMFNRGLALDEDDEDDPESFAKRNAESPLAIRDLSVAYGDQRVLSSVTFVTPPQAMIAIIGPNGAGKSTLLRASLGIIPRLSGEVTVFGRAYESMRQRIAYVPQRASVDWDFPATALDIVLMGLYREIGLFRFTGRRHEAEALAALERVGMASYAGRQIGQLSGGQQQRIFLARALVQNADLYVMDEPFAGVDASTEVAIIEVLKTLNRTGKTVLCVHHDLDTVPAYFDHVLLLNVTKIADGPVATTFTPDHLQAAYGGRLAGAQMDDVRAVLATAAATAAAARSSLNDARSASQ